MAYHEERLLFRDPEQAVLVLGAGDENLRRWEKMYDVRFRIRGNELIILGEKAEVQKVKRALQRLLRRVEYTEAPVSEDLEEPTEVLLYTHSGKPVRPVTRNQAQYLRTIQQNVVTFCIGPAGTGKTFLAVAYGVRLLQDGRIEKIILTRPAVEAGESLGFLPGDILEKVSPYLRPLYDALHELLGVEQTRRLMQREVVEIAPLAFMRGRTLKEAYVILDEAQNVKHVQMKMFLTRLGPNSKAVITGDVTQVDLLDPRESALREAVQLLQGIPGIAVVELTAEDVIRHPIVTRIIQAYEQQEAHGRE